MASPDVVSLERAANDQLLWAHQEIARLRAALERIASGKDPHSDMRIAREALNGTR